MITVTFIRHGQSEDNLGLRRFWNRNPFGLVGRMHLYLNMQANALGRSFSSTSITHIYASPLLRALATAQYIQHHQPDPKPPLKTNAHLREQYFGIAEGYPWVLQQPEDIPLEDLYQQRIFPVLYGRDAKFPEAESLNDLERRAEIALRECVLPHLNESQSSESEHSCVHVAIASHGLCIGELVAALVRLDPDAVHTMRFTGLSNTAWTRVNVRIREGHRGPIDPSNPPPLEVTITNTKEKNHLSTLNDIPHVELDGASAEARAFFGGESVQAS
ncbi:hypothetical protein CVT25_011490 [Psilocybe cyanescens]|uniref:Phosphoglycerate mutase n=1 Tax=Psilocybe cyanescens TaxID=93625 RepID=A0A409XA64_PSICY|nr:hypothetical protein CVT25_011490 [Psilocybe cyanescens]